MWGESRQYVYCGSNVHIGDDGVTKSGRARSHQENSRADERERAMSCSHSRGSSQSNAVCDDGATVRDEGAGLQIEGRATGTLQ